jgi:hypothetical protein
MYIAEPDDCSHNSQLSRICSAEVLVNTDWVDDLINNPQDEKKKETTFTDIFEDRSIEITNFDAQETTEHEVFAICTDFGEFESIDVSCKALGRIGVTFFDLRSAYAMVRSRICVRRLTWRIQFGRHETTPDPRNPPNNRTVVAFGIPEDVTGEMITARFIEFGQIRDVRKWTSHWFVEFWDARSATKAANSMNKRYFFGGKKRVELSRTGSARVNLQAILGRRGPMITRAKKGNGVKLETVKDQSESFPRVLKPPRSCIGVDDRRGISV